MVTCPTFSGIFSLAQKIDWGLPRMWMCQRDQNEGDGPRYKAVVLKVLCKTWSLPAFPLTGSIELLNMVQTFCHQAIKGLHENKFHWLLSVVHIHSSSGVRLWMSVALDIQKKKKEKKKKTIIWQSLWQKIRLLTFRNEYCSFTRQRDDRIYPTQTT